MTEVSLKLHKFFDIEISNLDELMGCMPRVEKLYMNNWTLKILAAGGIPKRLATPANLVKFLGLHFINFDDVAQISCALCLIRSFLNLQELELYAYAHDDAEMEPVLNFSGKQDCADCTLDQLRKVKIEGIEGSSAELEFIKHLLACSPLLELMLVRSEHYIDKDAELRICKELMRFSRASPKAEIVYCN
ncbi:hypothetical protein F0562_033918 [Nyssa sinensis]|uniref:FBD domain-containing protein n=1 Tax=Nyssa sinensis TaxID=561372 RepID=A0A5J5AE71_9ASTE|nr:hypothetical protein F0562_033918 [Nyssa sinensis]